MLIWPEFAALAAQSVLLGVLVLALAAGNGVALAFARFTGTDTETDTAVLASAAKYGAGFGLVLISAFKLVALFGTAVVPGYAGSPVEAVAVLGGMGAMLFAAFLALEWPRRIQGLDEAPYYSAVAGVFLVAGLLLKAIGVA